MDENTAQTILKAVDSIEKSISLDNYSDVNSFTMDVISASLASGFKIGVLVGEVLDYSIYEYMILLQRYALKPKESKMEKDTLLGLVKSIRSTISAGSNTEIYDSLSDLRMHVTREQKEGFPTKYMARGKIGRRI